MNPAVSSADPDTRGLFALFPPSDFLASHELIPAAQVPAPYHGLLVHEHHMTVTVEAYHREKVDVRVLEERRGARAYARKILLVTQQTRRVVQFGLVRIHLQYCSQPVRDEIVSGRTPLGRVLIQNDVLRRIEPTAFLRVVPGPAFMHWFSLQTPVPTYGRQAIIHCDGKPAIELLEIVAPEPDKQPIGA
jgi:chorismate-pyruvate lyase